tara:strand:- start:676 stop:2409 length:1734 start_codon:yes stop_codon:yes gene_type:complete
MAESLLIDVIVSLPLNKSYTYKTPRNLKIGSIVKVPFGHNNEKINAVTISNGYKKKTNYLVKNISSIENEIGIFSSKQIKFFKWISEYYLISLPKIFHSIIPKNILNIVSSEDHLINNNILSSQNYKTKLIVEFSDNYLKYLRKEIKFDKKNNFQYLILAPNILCSFEIFYSLKKIFKEKCSLYNSKISDKEKQKIWKNVFKSENNIVVGVKSATFLPFNFISKIIVIDEHDHLYKESDRILRYNARDCCVMLSKIHKCETHLISDTPSIESLFNVKKKKYEYINNIKKHNLKTNLANIQIINRFEKKIKEKIKGIISDEIYEEINKNYKKNKKSIIFTPFVSKISKIKSSLSEFNSNYNILSFTKKILESRKKTIDLIKKINSYDIIVGSHSLIGNLNSVNSNLIVLIDPDKISEMTDFKSNEKYFQIIFKLIQKISLKKKRKLIIQIAGSQDKTIQDCINLNYDKFIKNEISERKAFEFSPFYRIINIEIIVGNENELNKNGNKIYNQLKTGLKSIKISNFGIKNNKKRTKYQIVLKLKEDKNLKLNKLKILNKIEKIKKIKNYKKHLITLDIDP